MQQNVLDLFKVVIYLSTEKKMHHLKVESYVLFSEHTENLAWETGFQRALRGTYLIGSVVETPHFHCKWHGFNPWLGN